MNKKQTVSVIMPAYNEARTIHKIIDLVLKQECVFELIIVDDKSTDATASVIQDIAKTDARIKVLLHEVNQGKGAAFRTGIKAATGAIVLIQDADLEYDPSEYDHLIAPILNDQADIVFGNRFSGSGIHRVLYFWHSVGNRFLTILSNMMTNLNLSDMECCYKVFRREIIQSLTLQENRFGFEPEVTAKVSRLTARIFEVPVSYYGRTYAEGKKINWKDGFSAIRCILKYNLQN